MIRWKLHQMPFTPGLTKPHHHEIFMKVTILKRAKPSRSPSARLAVGTDTFVTLSFKTMSSDVPRPANPLEHPPPPSHRTPPTMTEQPTTPISSSRKYDV